MAGTHNYWLVLLSVVVAITASYVALESTARVATYREPPSRAVATNRDKAKWYWLTGGALSMGTGIWSMHFIGMLGFHATVPLSYDLWLTVASVVIAIIAAGFALYWVSSGPLGAGRLLLGALLMGAGIAGMHYVGMAALRMEPPIRYEPVLFTLSLLVAFLASLAALWSAFRLRMETFFSAFWKKAGSAVVMGTAIYGMHYTGMAAAMFDPSSVSTASPIAFEHTLLAAPLGAFALLFLMATLMISAFDAYLAARSSTQAEKLGQLNADLEQQRHELTLSNALLEQEVEARMRVEGALRRAQTALEARVAEELRGSLNAIMGYTATVLAELPGPLTAEQQFQLQAVQSSATHLLALIHDLLDVAKINAAEFAPQLEPIACQSVIEEALASVLPEANRKALTLNVTMPHETLVINTDRRALRQIVFNLVSNGVKFTDKGDIHVVLSKHQADSRAWIEFSVEDPGIGIHPADQTTIFAPLPQPNGSGNQTRERPGVGLHLSQKLAEMLGGRISFVSEYGKGTRFTLTLVLP
jgi:NO-binding membrane sensor protein with MHYT domain/nitrogen-specific signal transduction histidine kinase